MILLLMRGSAGQTNCRTDCARGGVYYLFSWSSPFRISQHDKTALLIDHPFITHRSSLLLLTTQLVCLYSPGVGL